MHTIYRFIFHLTYHFGARRTIQRATYSADGYGEEERMCLHCRHHHIDKFIIPMLVASSSGSDGSSSSSSGGNWGSGDSDGGGALQQLVNCRIK